MTWRLKISFHPLELRDVGCPISRSQAPNSLEGRERPRQAPHAALVFRGRQRVSGGDRYRWHKQARVPASTTHAETPYGNDHSLLMWQRSHIFLIGWPSRIVPQGQILPAYELAATLALTRLVMSSQPTTQACRRLAAGRRQIALRVMPHGRRQAWGHSAKAHQATHLQPHRRARASRHGAIEPHHSIPLVRWVERCACTATS
jgi:hypothetical protein